MVSWRSRTKTAGRSQIQIQRSEERIRGSGSSSVPKCHGSRTLIFILKYKILFKLYVLFFSSNGEIPKIMPGTGTVRSRNHRKLKLTGNHIQTPQFSGPATDQKSTLDQEGQFWPPSRILAWHASLYQLIKWVFFALQALYDWTHLCNCIQNTYGT